MNHIRRWLVWLSRMHHSRGFGIQSPSDYAFVRYVVSEHWPYYAYEELKGDDWLTQKLGRFYLRLANWRQPQVMAADKYLKYWHAGCRHTSFFPVADRLEEVYKSKVELARIDVTDFDSYGALLRKCDNGSVLVIEGIWRDKDFWSRVEQDERVGTTFDLYYCGVVFFDKHRYKHHYKINF